MLPRGKRERTRVWSSSSLHQRYSRGPALHNSGDQRCKTMEAQQCTTVDAQQCKTVEDHQCGLKVSTPAGRDPGFYRGFEAGTLPDDYILDN